MFAILWFFGGLSDGDDVHDSTHGDADEAEDEILIEQQFVCIVSPPLYSGTEKKQ
jgi:hypothetical protein